MQEVILWMRSLFFVLLNDTYTHTHKTLLIFSFFLLRVVKALQEEIFPLASMSENALEESTCFVYTERDYLVEILQKIQHDCPGLFSDKNVFFKELQFAFDKCI